MENMNKKVIWIILAIVIIMACCCCALLAALGFGGLTLYRQYSTEMSQPPAPIEEQITQIEADVINIRGLSPFSALNRGYLTPDELRQKVEEDFFKDYTAEEAADDVRVLNFFGLLPRDFPLYQFYIDLYHEQIAGYYDPETKEMYVVQDSVFDGPERMTYAHEYTHVLQDQNYDMRAGLKYNEDDCENQSEYCAAVSALIEGDATLTEQNWLIQHSTLRDKKEIQEFASTYTSPILDSAPAYINEDLMFPYLKGLTFVQSLYKDGGYAAIDAAYQQPPISTEQILHPERYPQDQPQDVTLDLSNVTGTGWRELDAGVMGEWYTYLILAYGHAEDARISEKTAASAAEGWGGDAYSVLWNDDASAGISVLLSQWESEQDADEFLTALYDYGTGRWQAPDAQSAERIEWQETSDGAVLMLRSGLSTLWIIAPNLDIASEISASALK